MTSLESRPMVARLLPGDELLGIPTPASYRPLTRGYGEIGRRDGFRYRWATVGVRVPLAAPFSSRA